MERKNPKQSLLPPQEIIQEILSRLPVKSLLKFRCVSKPWCSLIYSKEFMKLHLQNSTKNKAFPQHQIIINYGHKLMKKSHESAKPSPFDDPIINLLKSPRITGCCNGLVCIYELSQHYFLLWNPSTRIFNKLPQVHDKIDNSWFVCYHRLYQDEASDDFKVLAVLFVPWQFISKVYSLKTNSWRTTERRDWPSDIDYTDYTEMYWFIDDYNISYSNSMFEIKCFPQEYLYIESLVSPQV